MVVANPSWMPPPLDLRLSSGKVHIWRVGLDVPSTTLQRLTQTLSLDERQRAERFRFAHDRYRFIAGRGTLRAILGQYLKTEPAQIQFCYRASGKPSLITSPTEGGLEFNISHSQNLMLCAVAQTTRVGIDLEYLRPVDDLNQLTQRFFTTQEHLAIRALPSEEEQLQSFFQHWTCKEALLKAVGEGLVGLSKIEVAIANGSVKLVRCQADSEQTHQWVIELLSPAPNYVAAIAINSYEREYRNQLAFWQWKPEA
jgi:4'-phosphopantetheinyl transferase